MNPIDRLTELFMQFPGIGPRQAKRFVYFLLSRNRSYLNEFTRLVNELKDHGGVCSSCFRFFASESARRDECSVCRDRDRDATTIMVVAGNADLENIERSEVYKGRYFVLGGLVPHLEKEPEKRIRGKELKGSLEGRIKNGLTEIILALPANPDGDNTTEYLLKELGGALGESNLKISTLGRGLSTGLELEYSDKETLSHALRGRHGSEKQRKGR